MGKRHGVSYQKRVAEVNRIYDHYASHGVPNREIWRRYIYPVYPNIVILIHITGNSF